MSSIIRIVDRKNNVSIIIKVQVKVGRKLKRRKNFVGWVLGACGEGPGGWGWEDLGLDFAILVRSLAAPIGGRGLRVGFF